METIQLQPDQIAVFWDSIKHTILKSNDIPEDAEEKYLNKTLEKCLSGKLAVWLCFEIEDGEKKIHDVIVTSLIEDRLFGYLYVAIEGIFGFRRVSDEQAREIRDKLVLYTQNIGAKYLKALTNNPKAIRVCEAGGATKVGVVYSLEV